MINPNWQLLMEWYVLNNNCLGPRPDRCTYIISQYKNIVNDHTPDMPDFYSIGLSLIRSFQISSKK